MHYKCFHGIMNIGACSKISLAVNHVQCSHSDFYCTFLHSDFLCTV